MALAADVKTSIIEEYATHPGDTGSPEVQIALLTRRISDLTGHLKSTSTTTTVVVVCCCSSGQRRRLLNYLADTDIARYRALIERLGIRR